MMAPAALAVDPQPRTASAVALTTYLHRFRLAILACFAAALLHAFFFSARDALHESRIPIAETLSRAGAEWLAWAMLVPVAWWAAERWRLTSRRASAALWPHLAMAIVLALAQAGLFWLLLQLLAALGIAPVRLLLMVAGDDPRFLAVRFDSNLVIYAFVVAITTAIQRADETTAANRGRVEAERRLLDARLEALRQQLRPHFVLNALNTFLNALVTRPPEAVRILSALAGLLSRPEASAQLVTIREEVELVRLYATIEEARFRDRLTVEWAIDPAILDTPLPPFALQTLFENAISHATPRADGRFNVRVSAQRSEERVVVRIANDGAIGGSATHGTGIGLNNLSARLRLLFGGNANFDLYETGERTVARITLPLAAA